MWHVTLIFPPEHLLLFEILMSEKLYICVVTTTLLFPQEIKTPATFNSCTRNAGPAFLCASKGLADLGNLSIYPYQLNIIIFGTCKYFRLNKGD